MRNRVLIGLSITVLFLAGCTLAAAPPPSDNPQAAPVDVPPAAPLEAGPTNTTIPLPQPPAQGNPVLITITVPVVPGLTGPMAFPNGVALNCREGPHTAWPVVTVLNPDQGVEIAGQNEEGSWWYVKNPNLPGGYCWISADLTRVTGNANAAPKVAVSPPPVVYPTTEPMILSIYMGVKPDTINVAGCVGPIQPVTVWAKIQTDGPMVIKYHIEDDLVGNLKTRWVFFDRPDIQDISESFTPHVVDGTHYVHLVIGGDDYATAAYEIIC